MRLITFLFLILFSVLGCPGWATINVPGDADTLPHAIATATFTPGSNINLTSAQGNLSVTINAINSPLTITQSNKSFLGLYSTAGQPISISVSMVGTLVIHDMAVSVNGLLNCIDSGTLLGTTYVFHNDFYMGGGSSSFGFIQRVAPSFQNAFVYLNNFYGQGIAGKEGLGVIAAPVANNSVLSYKNFYSNLTVGIKTFNVSTFSGISSENDILDVCGQGVDALGPVSCQNNLFISCTTDAVFSGTGTVAAFSYSASTNSTSGWGTGCVSSISPSKVFCNKAKFYLSPFGFTSLIGTPIAGVTDQPGLNGYLLTQYGVSSMGANGYSPSVCGLENGDFGGIK